MTRTVSTTSETLKQKDPTQILNFLKLFILLTVSIEDKFFIAFRVSATTIEHLLSLFKGLKMRFTYDPSLSIASIVM